MRMGEKEEKYETTWSRVTEYGKKPRDRQQGKARKDVSVVADTNLGRMIGNPLLAALSL